MHYFEYGDKEIQYLKENDEILGQAIDEIGRVKRPIEPDIFSSLISSMVGQQISNQAALTVKTRLLELVGEITPENIMNARAEDIQQCGLTMRKAEYIKAIAQSVMFKEIELESLKKLPDNVVINELTQLKGIGEWTAEMLLIHSLQRPNVISYHDLAICRGMKNLYQLEELPKKTFNQFIKNYQPYATTASLYLWEVSKKS